MKSTDITIIAAPFGFGPTGKAIAIARELIRRGYSVKILGDENSVKLARDANILAYQYQYRTELNLADLRSKVVLSYLDISTKIINKSGIPLIFADSLFRPKDRSEKEYNTSKDRYPLGGNGAAEIADYLEPYLSASIVKNAYYRVSVKAKIKQDGKLILVKEDNKNWDLPGGGVEHNETIMEALERELKEEIGVDNFKVTAEPKLFKMIDASANRPLLFIVYEVEINSDSALMPSPNTEIGYFTKNDKPNVVDYSQEYKSYITQ